MGKVVMGKRIGTLVVIVAGIVTLTSCGSSSSQVIIDVTTTTAPPTTTSTLPPLPIPEPMPAQDAPDPNIRLGRVQIPAIKVDSPLFQGITMKTFDRGAGWWPGTAMPGQFGNVVVAGHRTTSPKPFRYLDKLKPGDEIIFETSAGRFVYLVTQTKIVDNSALWIIDQTPNFTATLFACHPLGSTAQRIVVFATLQGHNARV